MRPHTFPLCLAFSVNDQPSQWQVPLRWCRDRRREQTHPHRQVRFPSSFCGTCYISHPLVLQTAVMASCAPAPAVAWGLTAPAANAICCLVWPVSLRTNGEWRCASPRLPPANPTGKVRCLSPPALPLCDGGCARQLLSRACAASIALRCREEVYQISADLTGGSDASSSVEYRMSAMEVVVHQMGTLRLIEEITLTLRHVSDSARSLIVKGSLSWRVRLFPPFLVFSPTPLSHPTHSLARLLAQIPESPSPASEVSIASAAPAPASVTPAPASASPAPAAPAAMSIAS